MTFLDTDEEYFVTATRAEMVTALLEHLPQGPDDETLQLLAAACLRYDDPLEVSLSHA